MLCFMFIMFQTIHVGVHYVSDHSCWCLGYDISARLFCYHYTSTFLMFIHVWQIKAIWRVRGTFRRCIHKKFRHVEFIKYGVIHGYAHMYSLH